MSHNMHPSTVSQQVDCLAIANTIAGSLAVPIQLPFTYHFAQRRRVQ
jgi:hypothetical protein